jgi:tetratricopeptide (TPR) repeat protein
MSCTIARNKYWSDELDLWQDVLVKSPNKARPRFAVGSIYYRKLMPEKALPYLVRALELDSSQKSYWITLNHVIMQLGIYNGRCSDGKEFVISDSIDPANRVPWLAISYNNLGLAYEHSGNIYLAQENYKKAVAFNPALDLAWYNLALVSARRNDASTFSNSLKMLRAISPVLEQNAVKAIQEQNSVQLIPQ